MIVHEKHWPHIYCYCFFSNICDTSYGERVKRKGVGGRDESICCLFWLTNRRSGYTGTTISIIKRYTWNVVIVIVYQVIFTHRVVFRSEFFLSLSCRLYRTKEKKRWIENITKCVLDSLSSATWENDPFICIVKFIWNTFLNFHTLDNPIRLRKMTITLKREDHHLIYWILL